MRCLTPCILVATLLAGCATGPSAQVPLDHQPLLDDHGRPASLAFQPPAVRDWQAGLADTPWYASRADARLATQSGSRTPISTVTRIHTIDRQRMHRNHAHHDFSRTTRRYQVTAGSHR